jgi:transposase-like protein
MSRMLPGIETLEQHRELLQSNRDASKPERCPRCGKAGLHHHGHDERNAPRGEGLALALGPLIILRFFCPGCRGTCSRRPSCLSPRRQYWCKSQQAVLARLGAGESVRTVARQMVPSRRTVGRWRHGVEEEFDLHGLPLRSRFAELGRAVDGKAFWSLCLQSMSLSEAMGWRDRMGVCVP